MLEYVKHKKRPIQKCLAPRNKREFTKIALQIFVNSSLFPKELLFSRRLFGFRVHAKTDF
nr:hypothetical protein [Enterococcus crotali]